MKMMLGQFSFVLYLALTLALDRRPAVNSKHQEQQLYKSLGQNEQPYSMSMDNVPSSDQYKFERMNSFPRQSDVNLETVATGMTRHYQDDGLVDPSIANAEYRGPLSLQGDGLSLDRSLVRSQRDPQYMFDVGVGSDFRLPRGFEVGVGSDFRLPGNDFVDQNSFFAPGMGVSRPYSTGFQPDSLYSDSKNVLSGFSDDEGRALLNGDMLSSVSNSRVFDGGFTGMPTENIANVQRRGRARFPSQSLDLANLHAPLRSMNRLSPSPLNRLPYSNVFRPRSPQVYSPQNNISWRNFFKYPIGPRNRAMLTSRNIVQGRPGRPVKRLQRHAARTIQIYPNPVRNIGQTTRLRDMGLSRSRLPNQYNLRSLQIPLPRTAARSYNLLPAKTSQIINNQPPYQGISKLRLPPKRSQLTQPSGTAQFTNLF